MPFSFLGVNPNDQVAVFASSHQLPLYSFHSVLDKMADNSVFAAIGAVLGYIGAEAATKQCLERLLWPQRAYSNFSLRSAPMLALLTPMGGPLHKVGMKVLDVLFEHGLLKSPRTGHMLGTTFFPKLGWSYTIWDENGEKLKSEELRNNVWVRALEHMAIPTATRPYLEGSSSGSEGEAEKGITAPTVVRALVTVSHFTFTKATDKDKTSKLPFVSEPTKTPTLRIFAAIFVSELSAIIVAIILLAVVKSLWAIWWFAPLLLRLLSAFFTLHRQPVLPLEASAFDEKQCDYEVHCPQAKANFILLTGPRSVVDQFFIHYGHPDRNRFLEVIQFAIIVLLGSVFPFGLFCSAIWMPLNVQYAWLCYQLYVVVAMLITRYYHGGDSTNTEAHIAEEFSKKSNGRNGGNGDAETSILFGQDRHGSGTMKVSLSVVYHSRYREGQAYMNRLLQRRKLEDNGN
jgi:hypothetical protein